MLEAAGARVQRARAQRHRLARRAARAGRARGAGRRLVGGAARRRRDAASPGSELTVHGVEPEPAAHRAARRARSAWAPASPSSTAGGSAASPSATSTSGRRSSSAPRSCAKDVPRARRRAAALRARGGVCARRERRPRRSRAPRRRRPTGSRRSSTGCAALGAHIRATPDGFVVRGVPTRLRGGTLDARGDHRIAMLGAVAGLGVARGRRGEGRRGRGSKLPRLLRPPRIRCATSTLVIVAIDGPAGAGKSTVARRLARAAPLPLPRHRRHVPRADVARDASAGCRSTAATTWPRSPREHAGRVRRRAAASSSPAPT